MESIQRLRRITAVGAALALLLLPALAFAELAKWDQARVTEIAEELAPAIKELRQELMATQKSVEAVARRSLYEALEDVRIMVGSATHLASELKAGKGYDETYPIWRRLDMLRRDFEQNARMSELDDTLMEKILNAGELLIRLTPYYSSDQEGSQEGAGS